MQGLESILAKHPFCAGMPQAYVELFAGCATNKKFAPGEVIFRQGDDADTTYLVRAGRISFELHTGGRTLSLETAEEGEIVGWSFLFPPYRWHFDAVAASPVRVLEFDGTCLRNKCETDDAFGYDLVKRILKQASKRLERSRLQALDVYGGGG